MEASQLWERLQATVEDIASSNLTGKARRAHLVQKAARLGGVDIPKPTAPFRMRKGMEQAQQWRAKKAKAAQREMDGAVAARPYTAGAKSVSRGTRHRR